MASQKIEIGRLCDEYHAATDDGREQLFQNVWTSYYRGPDTSPDELANTLKTLLFSLDVLPKEPLKDSSWIEVMQEICSGMQRFCLSMPPGIDYAWNAMTLFISKLSDQRYEKDQFDLHTFAVDDLKYWVSQYPSWNRCDMQGVTECSVRDDDNSVLTVTQDQWDENPAEQLAALARNRRERNMCVVDKVIAARALRDGYAPAENFMGAYELRYIEFALRRGTHPERHEWCDDMYQTSCDVIAATFCLRAGASSILECLPIDGCEFADRWRIAPVKAGLEGRRERLEGWRKALEGFVVGREDTQKGGGAFAVVAYAAMALENLREPRDETSAELFSCIPSCVHCNTVSSTLKLCGSCKAVSYCNRTCQQADWNTHKPLCAKPGPKPDPAQAGEVAQLGFMTRDPTKPRLFPTIEEEMRKAEREGGAFKVPDSCSPEQRMANGLLVLLVDEDKWQEIQTKEATDKPFTSGPKFKGEVGSKGKEGDKGEPNEAGKNGEEVECGGKCKKGTKKA